MPAGPPRRGALDTRIVFSLYAWIALTAGTLVYLWPGYWLPDAQLFSAAIPWGPFAITRVAAAAVAFAGCCAAGFARIDDPVVRRRALYRFALAHLLFGAMFWVQWFAIFDEMVPPLVGWAPLLASVVLWYLASAMPATSPVTHSLADYLLSRPIADLRSQYEEQIRHAARREERERLARELHDAVKQQLFVVQTAAATAQARFGADPPGAKTALEQVRTAAREATAELDALLEQLQAAPLENAGLVQALQKQVEAFGFRTGAIVRLDVGELPPSASLPPGVHQAMFRIAQEALSNAARHARARHVQVTVNAGDSRLRLASRMTERDSTPARGYSGWEHEACRHALRSSEAPAR